MPIFASRSFNFCLIVSWDPESYQKNYFRNPLFFLAFSTILAFQLLALASALALALADFKKIRKIPSQVYYVCFKNQEDTFISLARKIENMVAVFAHFAHFWGQQSHFKRLLLLVGAPQDPYKELKLSSYPPPVPDFTASSIFRF